MAKTIKFNESKWQAEEDARTLARYSEIQGDKKRLSAANKAAKTLADSYAKQAEAYKFACGGKIKKR